MNDEKNMVPVGTKIAKQMVPVLKAIMAQMGMTIYDFLQLCLDVVIRLRAADREPVSEELARAIRLFDNLRSCRDHITLCDDPQKMQVLHAFYLLGERGKAGRRMVGVGEEMCGTREVDYNIQRQFEQIAEVLLPDAYYRKLRLLGVEYDTNSLYETLLAIIDDHIIDQDTDELHRLFSDNRRSDYGRRTDTDTRYQQKRTPSMERYEQQLFNADQDEQG